MDNLDAESAKVISGVKLNQMGAGDASKAGFFLNVHLSDSFIEDQVNALLQGSLDIARDEEFKA